MSANLKDELRAISLLIMVFVGFAIFFQSVEVAWVVMGSLCIHELGHLIPILRYRVPGRLVVLPLGLATWSDIRARRKLGEFNNSLIHLGGPIANLLFVLAALLMHSWFGQRTNYWLGLANVSALIGFLNLLVIGEASDGGKYMYRLFTSLSERWDKVLLVLSTSLSIVMIVTIIMVFGTNSVIWIALIGIWMLVSLYRADRTTDNNGLPKKRMNRKQAIISYSLYLVVFVGLGVTLLVTPFPLTQTQAIRIAEFITTAVVTIIVNFPKIVMVSIIFLSLTIPHELGHLVIGLISKIKITRLVVGSPKGEPWLKFNLGVPWEFYRLPILAALETNDEVFVLTSGLKKTLYALAGPAVNIILAVIVTTLAVGFSAALSFTTTVSFALVKLIGAFLIGWTGLFGGSEYFLNGLEPIRVQAETLGISQLLMVFVVLQLFIAIFNLLPIPGLDGGWILLSYLTWDKTRGRSTTERVQIRRNLYDGWVRFASKYMVKTIAILVVGLTIIHFVIVY